MVVFQFTAEVWNFCSSLWPSDRIMGAPLSGVKRPERATEFSLLA